MASFGIIGILMTVAAAGKLFLYLYRSRLCTALFTARRSSDVQHGAIIIIMSLAVAAYIPIQLALSLSGYWLASDNLMGGAMGALRAVFDIAFSAVVWGMVEHAEQGSSTNDRNQSSVSGYRRGHSPVLPTITERE